MLELTNNGVDSSKEILLGEFGILHKNISK